MPNDHTADPIAAQLCHVRPELAWHRRTCRPDRDDRWVALPGIVHRYPIGDYETTLLCPVYCRFCFRRRVVGKKGACSTKPFRGRLRLHPSASADLGVIVTGGDPFFCSRRAASRISFAFSITSRIWVSCVSYRVPVVDSAAVKSCADLGTRRGKGGFMWLFTRTTPGELDTQGRRRC